MLRSCCSAVCQGLRLSTYLHPGRAGFIASVRAGRINNFVMGTATRTSRGQVYRARCSTHKTLRKRPWRAITPVRKE